MRTPRASQDEKPRELLHTEPFHPQPCADDESDPMQDAPALDRPNRPRYFILRVQPLLAACSLVLATLCVIASLSILLVADGEAVANWRPQPSVYLSTTVTISNALIRLAFTTALPMWWWRNAMRGATVKSLHQNWNVGDSLWQTLVNWKRFGYAPAACIATTLLLLDGPLIQRALTVRETVPTQSFDITLHLAPELPTGAGGIVHPNGNWDASVSESEIFQQWLHKQPIRANASGCAGICQATIEAPGLTRDSEGCMTSEITLSGSRLPQWPQSEEGQYLVLGTKLISRLSGPSQWDGPRIPSTVIPNSTHSSTFDRETVSIFVAYANTLAGEGSITLSQCDFVSAILAYDILVDGDVIELQNAGSAPTKALANNTKPITYHQDQVSTITTLLDQASAIFNSEYSFTTPFNTSLDGLVTQIGNLSLFGWQHIYPGKAGTFKTTNPLPDILSALNEMIFRGGIAAASVEYADFTKAHIDPGLPIIQTVPGHRTDRVSTYHCGYGWWAGASALQALAIVLIVPLISCGRKQGRTLSFSPVEIARAFGAPILQSTSASAGAKELVRELGTLRVRYEHVGGSRSAAADSRATGEQDSGWLFQKI